jgi:hypothetical protein
MPALTRRHVRPRCSKRVHQVEIGNRLPRVFALAVFGWRLVATNKSLPSIMMAVIRLASRSLVPGI